ncbi:hypothetical protein GLOIN_2v1635553 [Rhizophagus irregularis DAOM 181602=DAOM 197198]|nr:hypothetical protein GLOIN_2v1635553 [Rhizophagus irregularis DAOM 181602=DAOM 197198]POG68490.1 hypothetical protein GLOIN_2v1635553 [Rhizophagus irregularis DAOM 181602=DAOM 197198]|eukprot:XP_025175356.1 hypothetical protein GLOIN_2v1635553 [Rhizophagus irregularis DAOM 181602=DAOM 197198]
MKSLFGLKADDYNELPTFAGGVKETPEEIRNLVIGEFLRLHKTSQHITSANEATRCEYISRIIYGVASIYGGEIKVYPQYEISGGHGKGPVDWAIKIGNIIITITEAKKEDINKELHRMRSNCRHPSSAILKNELMIRQVCRKT